MKRRIEDYWQKDLRQWLGHAFPLDRVILEAIITDITEKQYTSAEAIVKHIAEGSGIAPSEFTRLVLEQFRRQLRNEDVLEFVDGYGRLTSLLQAGFFLAAEGPGATKEIMRQWNLAMSRERFNFLAENIELAASLIRQDVLGRTMMTRFAHVLTQTSKRTYFNEGVFTANDTFMAYSKSVEGIFDGQLY